jgi:hypothetical protein
MPPAADPNVQTLTPFSEEDRTWLEQHRQGFTAFADGPAAVALSVLFPAFMAGGAALAVFVVGMWAFGYWFLPLDSFLRVHEDRVRWWVAGAVGGIVVVLGLLGDRRRRVRFALYLADMDRYLAEGLARVELLQVDGVKVLREVEHGTFMLCLRLSEGAI